jgi:RNA polymerase sigma-70 factor (ECF subfamily)
VLTLKRVVSREVSAGCVESMRGKSLNPEGIMSFNALGGYSGVMVRHNSSTISDNDIIGQVLEGDVNAFEGLIERYRNYVFKIVMRHVPMEDVEEVAHDVFVRTYKSLPKFGAKSEFKHWLSRIATRTCYDFWRNRYRSGEIPMSDLSESQQNWLRQVIAGQATGSFEEAASRDEARELIDWALSRLSAEDRTVIELVYLEELSVQEAADRLGWTKANVKIRTHRSKKKLRKILEQLIRQQGGQHAESH